MSPLDKLLVNYVHTNQVSKAAGAIQKGADVNCADGLPLITAAYVGHKKILKLLCAAGATAGLEKAREVLEGNDDLLRILNAHADKLANKRLK